MWIPCLGVKWLQNIFVLNKGSHPEHIFILVIAFFLYHNMPEDFFVFYFCQSYSSWMNFESFYLYVYFLISASNFMQNNVKFDWIILRALGNRAFIKYLVRIKDSIIELYRMSSCTRYICSSHFFMTVKLRFIIHFFHVEN